MADELPTGAELPVDPNPTDDVKNDPGPSFRRGGPNVLSVIRAVEQGIEKALERNVTGRIQNREYKYAGWESVSMAVNVPLGTAGGASSFQLVYDELCDWVVLYVFHVESCEFMTWQWPIATGGAQKDRGADVGYAKRNLYQLAFSIPIADEDNKEEDELNDNRTLGDASRRTETAPPAQSGGNRPAPTAAPRPSDKPAAITAKQQEFLTVVSKGRAMQLNDEKTEDGKSKWGSVGELDAHDTVLTDLGYTKPGEGEGEIVITPALIAYKSFDKVLELIRNWSPTTPPEGSEEDDTSEGPGDTEEEPAGESKPSVDNAGEELPS